MSARSRPAAPDHPPEGWVRAMSAAAAAESKFRQLLEFAPDAILGVGADGRIELINSQVSHLFGYERDELIGQPVDILVPERFRDSHAGHRAGYFRDRQTRPMGAGLELYARRRDGSEFPCEISLSWIAGDDGTVALAAVRDVTRRKETEAEAERLKSEFFALVSHELRTPLTAIAGYVDLLQELESDGISARAREFLDIVERNTERLDELVQDLLLVAQVEAGTFSIDEQPVDIDELTMACRPEAQLAAAQAGVELSCDVAPGIPTFTGDPKRLGQVLQNLVSNAIKFTPPGGKVHVSIAAEGDSCLIEISDTGVGIEPDDLARLFDRFYRSRRADRDHVRGTGLGLAITKAIVDSHGGRVEVDSVVGKGSTFRVLLPMRPYGQERPDHPREGRSRSRGARKRPVAEVR